MRHKKRKKIRKNRKHTDTYVNRDFSSMLRDLGLVCLFLHRLWFITAASEGWGKVIFSVCSHPGEVGTMSKVWGGVGVGYPSQVWDGGVGGTPARSRWWGGYPGYPPPTRQRSIESTCYVAGSMPLALMREDFLF